MQDFLIAMAKQKSTKYTCTINKFYNWNCKASHPSFVQLHSSTHNAGTISITRLETKTGFTSKYKFFYGIFL